MMFDLSKLFDQATEMLKDGSLHEFLSSDLSERLSNLGIDSLLSDNVQIDDIQTLLDGAGIDPASLNDAQLSELMTAASENGGIEGLDLSAFFNR